MTKLNWKRRELPVSPPAPSRQRWDVVVIKYAGSRSLQIVVLTGFQGPQEGGKANGTKS
jgi:hypothetical protein